MIRWTGRLLVPSGDVSALVAAVEQCLEAPARLRMRVLSARSRVEGELPFEARQAGLLGTCTRVWSSCTPPARSNR